MVDLAGHHPLVVRMNHEFFSVMLLATLSAVLGETGTTPETRLWKPEGTGNTNYLLAIPKWLVLLDAE